MIASPIVRFDCAAKFKAEPFALDHYASNALKTTHFAMARKLMKTNADRLPPDN